MLDFSPYRFDLATELNDEDERQLYDALSPQRRGMVNQLRGERQIPLLGRLRVDLIALIVDH
jgi:hypothetical protein